MLDAKITFYINTIYIVIRYSLDYPGTLGQRLKKCVRIIQNYRNGLDLDLFV